MAPCGSPVSSHCKDLNLKSCLLWECLPTTMLVWWVCAESQTQGTLLIRILLTSTVTSVQQSAHHPSGVVSHRGRSLTRGPFDSRVSILVHCRDIIILGLKLCTHVATEKPDMHTHQFIDLLDWQSCAGIGGWQVLAFFCPSGQKSGNVSAGSDTLVQSHAANSNDRFFSYWVEIKAMAQHIF